MTVKSAAPFTQGCRGNGSYSFPPSQDLSDSKRQELTLDLRQRNVGFVPKQVDKPAATAS